MRGAKWRLERTVSCLLVSAAACLASGNALATCIPGTIDPGEVPCYMTVQPIDVGVGSPLVYGPFNTVSATAGVPDGLATLSVAGQPLQTVPDCSDCPSNPPPLPTPVSIPNNSISNNPIGFVVDPATGQFPGDGVSAQWPRTNPDGTVRPGVDVTRELLNNLGVEVVWLPMTRYSTTCPPGTTPCVVAPAPQDFSTLQVDLAPTGPAIANCTGFILSRTLTISACSAGMQPLAVYDFLSTTATGFVSGTYITAFGTGSGGAGTYTVSSAQTVGGSGKKQVTITAQSFTLTSDAFKTLSNQPNISTGGPPASWVNPQGTTVNLFFVQKLNPPAAMGGKLYGFAWLCNNGVAIAASTFASPPRPDTIAHELLHNLCLDHANYGAGPWTTATGPLGSYLPPFGVVPQLPDTPLPSQCDGYTACAANLMTTGILRTAPTLACILAGYPTTSGPTPVPAACIDASGNQKPGLFNPDINLQTDQVTFPSSASLAQLPVPQQTQVLGRSGLLFTNSPTLQFSGLLNAIPHETTKAQLGTGGSSTGQAIFDLSGPAGGKPGETLLGWVLTLPQEQTLAKHDGFHIVSQSRKDLVQDVRYYPGPGNNPLKRNIAYQPGGDNNADDPSIAAASPSPCAFATAECLVVKFQPPGLEANDSISFSKSILSGDAPITNEDLCKAKITYIFSDGFVTTSNFGRCPSLSLPLVANSWHPDPYVAPHIVKSDVLLVNGGFPLPCTEDPDNLGHCRPLEARDHDVTQEAQDPQSCDGGLTLNNPVTGIIPGPELIISGGQKCRYQDCHFLGSLTINNATASLQNCQVDGNLTMNSGSLRFVKSDLPTSVFVRGNVQIGSKDSLPNSFSIGPQANIHGNLAIQNLPSGGLGYVCGTTVSGGVSVNNNQSLIQVGESGQQTNCPINTIAGGFSCKNSTPPVTGGLSGGILPQCK
jgi:hypothetical protein